MRKNPFRLAAIIVIMAGFAAAMPFVFGCLVINVTPSVPIGLWLLTDGAIRRGDYVLVMPDKFAAYELYKKYPFRKNPMDRPIPLLKLVGGVAGDLVERSGDILYINQRAVPKSNYRYRDSSGHALIPFELPLLLRDNQAWLISHTPKGFDSRYLGPVNLEDCKRARPLLIF